jgi:hypothetical protein
MDRVWFKLKQTHYPPPLHDEILSGCTGDEAPICLGHVIKDLKRLDFPLNQSTILPFPPTINVFATSMVDFKWNVTKSSGKSNEAGATAPIAAAAGMNVGGSIKLAFSSSVGDHEQFDKLDTYIFQPTQSYIADALAKEPLAMHVRRKIRWSLFVITGLCIARKGKTETSETHGREVGESIEAYYHSLKLSCGVPKADQSSDLPTIAGAHLRNAFSRETSRALENVHTSDFVWAIRLAKIHQGLLNEDWSIESYTKRATFDMAEEELDVAEVLNKEGLEGFTVVEDEGINNAFVL